MEIGTLGAYFFLFIALYFEVFLLLCFFEHKPSLKNTDKPKHYPSVSMLVPCYNEEKTLAHTVTSLLNLEYPKDKLEILIIDDGSTDNTRAIGEALARVHSEQGRAVRFYHKQNGGKYTALNFGIERSSGELIGCLDADSFVAPDALVEVVKKFEQETDAMAATPAMKVYRPRNMLELMQAVEYTFGIFYKKMFDNLAALNVLPGPFSLYKRAVFDTIGPFRHAYNTEDMEIAFRMHANGLKIVNAHTAFVYTTVPKTVPALVKQRTRWSQGFLQNSKDYAYMYFNPRYGNFGMLVLPFALTAFFGGLYMATFVCVKLLGYAAVKIASLWSTGVPLQVPTSHIAWYTLNTSMMTMLVIATMSMTLTAIFIGSRISKTRLPLGSFVSYFLLFGFVAPLWLARAAWGAARSRDASWP